jgi:hypothetical protein
MKQKMVLTGRKITFANAEEQDTWFWADKTWQERLAETERLRRLIWTHILGTYPTKMQKVGKVVRRTKLD